MSVTEGLLSFLLPNVIGVLELIGTLIVLISAAQAFYEYALTVFRHRRINLELHFSRGLVTALEFKMAAEILKTVLVRDLDELLVLGAVVLLRAVLSLLIHFEMQWSYRHKEE